jgi:hypothetical protein
MQRCTIVFITINVLHISGGFFAHHQEFKTVHTASGTFQLTRDTGMKQKKLDKYPMLCVSFELLMMDGGTA